MSNSTAEGGNVRLNDGLCPRSRCDSCGWIGNDSEIRADYTIDAYSNSVCPSCGMWDDLERVGDNAQVQPPSAPRANRDE